MLRLGSIVRTLVPRGLGSRLSGDRGARFLASVLVGFVDDVDEAVVEVGADGVGVGGGVVALAAQDGDELGAGFVEAAAFADGLEAAVQLERSGAVTVAEQPTMQPGHRIGHGCPVVGCAVTLSASTAPVAVKYCSATVVSEMRA